MIAFKSLEEIGFTRNDIVIDEDLKYQDCDISAGESYISVCNNLSSDGHVINQTIIINDRELKGSEPTIELLSQLIKIL